MVTRNPNSDQLPKQSPYARRIHKCSVINSQLVSSQSTDNGNYTFYIGGLRLNCLKSKVVKLRLALRSLSVFNAPFPFDCVLLQGPTTWTSNSKTWQGLTPHLGETMHTNKVRQSSTLRNKTKKKERKDRWNGVEHSEPRHERLHSLHGSVQNENFEPFIHPFLRIPRWHWQATSLYIVGCWVPDPYSW